METNQFFRLGQVAAEKQVDRVQGEEWKTPAERTGWMVWNILFFCIYFLPFYSSYHHYGMDKKTTMDLAHGRQE